MRIEYMADGYDELESLLDGLKDGNRDTADKRALVAFSETLEKRVSMRTNPRSKNIKDTHRKYKGRAKPGHILDNIRHKDPELDRGGYSILVGVPITTMAKHAGFGYAVPLSVGTASMRAQPFLEPEFETMMQNPAFLLDVYRKGLMGSGETI